MNFYVQGQYVKWVSPNGPAELSGMLTGDHVLEVDGVNVTEESHQKVLTMQCPLSHCLL